LISAAFDFPDTLASFLFYPEIYFLFTDRYLGII
jgi:hypothetical protein